MQALMANAATSALRLHQRLPQVQFTRQFLFQFLLEDSGSYSSVLDFVFFRKQNSYFEEPSGKKLDFWRALLWSRNFFDGPSGWIQD